MFKFVSAVALSVAVATPALAADAAAQPFSFVADGTSFSGTRTQVDGVTTLIGRQEDGKPFRLRVKNNRVTGTFGTTPIDFQVAESRVETALR